MELFTIWCCQRCQLEVNIIDYSIVFGYVFCLETCVSCWMFFCRPKNYSLILVRFYKKKSEVEFNDWEWAECWIIHLCVRQVGHVHFYSAIKSEDSDALYYRLCEITKRWNKTRLTVLKHSQDRTDSMLDCSKPLVRTRWKLDLLMPFLSMYCQEYEAPISTT